MSIEKVEADAEAARLKALAAINAEESWIERHPRATTWIYLGSIALIITLAVKSCA